MAREAMDVCLRVLKDATKVSSNNYSFRKSELIISYITLRDCRVHMFFRQPFSKYLYSLRASSPGRSGATPPERPRQLACRLVRTAGRLYRELKVKQ